MTGGVRMSTLSFALTVAAALAAPVAAAAERWEKFEGNAKTPTVWADLDSVQPFTKPWSAYGIKNEPLAGPFYSATVRTFRIESNYPAGSVETEQLCFYCDDVQALASSACGATDLRSKDGKVLDSAEDRDDGALIFLDHQSYGNTGLVSAAQAVCKQVKAAGLPLGKGGAQ